MTRTPALVVAAALLTPVSALAQGPDAAPGGRDQPGAPGGFGPGGFPGMMMREDIKLLDDHDQNADGWLNTAEREAARADLAQRRAQQPASGPGRRGPGPGGGRFGPQGQNREPATPGPRMTPADVDIYPDTPLYDVDVLRTIFLDFESDGWEAELQDFYGTDVEVPATMIVDGVTYANVGVSFRGMSSYMMVPAGHKRSLNVSLDLADNDQRLQEYKTLNLLNCNGDPSLMSSVLYSQLAPEHLPVPKACLVRVVINGEYWGVYASVQQFDKVLTEQNFGSSQGTRWKVPGSPGGDGGLTYLGEDLEPYQARYEMKSSDGRTAWVALIELCRTLNQTPPDQLAEALDPILDVDGALWFLACDVVFSNSDGYWTRASDYSLFRDKDGRFHIIPHDMNEAFQVAARGPGPGGPGGPGAPGAPSAPGAPDGARTPPEGFTPPPGGRMRGGPRGPGGPGGGGVNLDPLIGLDNDRTPLRSRLLAVPALRDRYLQHVRHLARTALDPQTLGPRIARCHALIDQAVAQDTRKLSTYEAFLRATAPEAAGAAPEGSLLDFAHRRRAYLLGEAAASAPSTAAPQR